MDLSIFDFDATTVGGLYGMTVESAKHSSEKMVSIVREIIENHNKYTFEASDNGETQVGVHRGKVLKRFFESAVDDKERVFLVHAFEHFLNQINKGVSVILLKENLSKTLQEDA